MTDWKRGKQLNNGKYIIESILFRSGSALAYRARTRDTEELVTIKTIQNYWQSEGDSKKIPESLIQQAFQISSCQHPNLAKLYPQILQHGDRIYMVAEYVPGENLASHVDRQGKLRESEGLTIISKIGSALNIFHEKKFIHQDLKPQNIVLHGKTGEPILIDRGFAIELFARDSKIANGAATDYFSPPEIYSNSPEIGPQTDIYSLGAILYVLLTGKFPTPSKFRQYQQLIPPRQHNPKISDRINRAILKTMELEPLSRPQSMREWSELLSSPARPLKLSPRQNETKTFTNNLMASPEANLDTVLQKKTLATSNSTSTSPAKAISTPEIETFDFETVILEKQRSLFGLSNRLKKNVVLKKGKYFGEYLGAGIDLEMIFIPGGSFLMGSDKNEIQRRRDESPQHRVTLPSFYLSKYPITQSQWRLVASLPQASRRLSAHPSSFKGDSLPVEKISWHDAKEFCDRLSQHTGRKYRLPTEAEWEYACRGGTATPFCYGETITTELANYDGRKGYGSEGTGKYEKKTSSAGSFSPNPFGLYDLHGNVWEWCEDHYAPSYQNHPQDGSAYYSNMNNQPRVVRGGSWSLGPDYCRSASRSAYAADSTYNFVGFRVVCAPSPC